MEGVKEEVKKRRSKKEAEELLDFDLLGSRLMINSRL